MVRLFMDQRFRLKWNRIKKLRTIIIKKDLSNLKASHGLCNVGTRLGYMSLVKWWAHLGSNQGPTGYEPVALPAELWARCQS